MEELEPRLLFSADLPGVLAQSGLLGGDILPTPPAITALVDAPAVGVTIGNNEQTPGEAAFALINPKATATAQKELVFRECCPNYLTFSWPTFLAGVAYERMVSSCGFFEGIRVNILGVFEKVS